MLRPTDANRIHRFVAVNAAKDPRQGFARLLIRNCSFCPWLVAKMPRWRLSWLEQPPSTGGEFFFFFLIQRAFAARNAALSKEVPGLHFPVTGIIFAACVQRPAFRPALPSSGVWLSPTDGAGARNASCVETTTDPKETDAFRGYEPDLQRPDE